MDEKEKISCIECKRLFDKLELNKLNITSTPTELYICNLCIKNTSHASDVVGTNKDAGPNHPELFI